MVCFQVSGKNLTSFQSIEKEKNILLKITTQFLYSQYVVKFRERVIIDQVSEFFAVNELLTLGFVPIILMKIEELSFWTLQKHLKGMT